MTKTTTSDATAKEQPVRARKRPINAVTKLAEPTSNLNEPLTHGANYTLESQNLIVEMSRLHDNALAEIQSIEAEQTSIHERAQRDMQTIADRAKAEIDARGMRITDLKRSISVISNGLKGDPGMVPLEQKNIESIIPPSTSDESEHEG